MLIALVDKLMNMIRPKLTKHDPRKPLTAELKVAAVLRYIYLCTFLHFAYVI